MMNMVQYETMLARAFEVLDMPPNEFYNPEITQIPPASRDGRLLLVAGVPKDFVDRDIL